MDNIATYLLDLIQNGVAAQAKTITCEIIEDDLLHVTLSDDGRGMSQETLRNASSPYFTTRKTRKVGLGLSMIKMLTEQTEGSFVLESTEGVGTTLKVIFNHHHIDMPPLGDLGEMVMLVSINQDVEEFIFTYKHQTHTYTYQLSTIKEMLKETIFNSEIIQYLTDYINQEIMKVRGIK